jgi:hypothetical protein
MVDVGMCSRLVWRDVVSRAIVSHPRRQKRWRERMSGVGSGCSGRRRVSSSKLYATMHPLTARVQGLWRRARNAGAGGGSLAVRCDEGADQQQVRGGLIPAWLGTARTARNLSGPPQHCFLTPPEQNNNKSTDLDSSLGIQIFHPGTFRILMRCFLMMLFGNVTGAMTKPS